MSVPLRNIAIIAHVDHGTRDSSAFDAEFVGQLLRSSGAQDVAFQERHVWALSRDSRHGGRDLSAFFRLGIRKAFAGFLGNEAQHDQVIAR